MEGKKPLKEAKRDTLQSGGESGVSSKCHGGRQRDRRRRHAPGHGTLDASTVVSTVSAAAAAAVRAAEGWGVSGDVGGSELERANTEPWKSLAFWAGRQMAGAEGIRGNEVRLSFFP